MMVNQAKVNHQELSEGDLLPVLNVPACLTVVPAGDKSGVMVPIMYGELYSTRKRNETEWKKRVVRLVGRRLELYIGEQVVLRQCFDIFGCAIESKSQVA
jgi:hypothetical protein